MSLSFVLLSLVLLCFLVSLVYALTSCDVTDKILKETLWSFVLMLGGILFLALIIKVVPAVFIR